MPPQHDKPLPGQRPPPGQRQLSPFARTALTALVALVVAVNVVILLNRLGPPAVPDTSARLRAAGGPVHVYRAREGDAHIYLLKPGTTIALGDVHRLPGPRFPVHVTVDRDASTEGTTAEGFIDAKDFEPGELDRVKSILEKWK